MSLPEIYEAIAGAPENLWAKELGYAPVYQVSESSKIVVVGQAPGIKAQKSSVPWDDASGDKLRTWLSVSKKQFYDSTLFALLPMDFFYPGKGPFGDLPPRKGVAERWHPQIIEQLKAPELFILVGSYAQRYYLASDKKQNLTENVRAYHEYLPRYFPVVHPSPLNFRWQSKNPWFEEAVVPELRRVVKSVLLRNNLL